MATPPVMHVTIYHVPHGNYKIICPVCGRALGDYTGDVPARALFARMAGHLSTQHHGTAG